jgi:hypothetical protein
MAGLASAAPLFFSYWGPVVGSKYMHVMYANISPMLWPQLACHDGPFGGIMYVTCLFRTATKQRTCALSDTLSARVLLVVLICSYICITVE